MKDPVIERRVDVLLQVMVHRVKTESLRINSVAHVDILLENNLHRNKATGSYRVRYAYDENMTARSKMFLSLIGW